MSGSTTEPDPTRLARVPLLVVCLGYFLVILDTTVVNVALPAIGRGLHARVGGLQWVVDAYTVVLAGLLLSAGALGDRLGSRRVFVAGLVLFTAASAACGLAPSLALLVGARVLQGAGAALLVPTSLALLHAAHPDRAARARAVGAWGAIAGVAAASGPIVGGAVTSALSWRVAFLVNIPLGVAGLALGGRHLPDPPGTPRRGLDLAGQLAGIAALASLTAALIEGGSRGFTSVGVAAGLLVALIAAAAFVLIERRAESPMLPLGLFRRPDLSAGTAIGLAINLAFYGQLFVASLYFQHLRGYSPLGAGLALLPLAILVSLGSALSGQTTARRGPRVTMLAGLCLGAAGFLGWTVVGAHSAYPLLVPALLAIGFGMSYTMPAATTAVTDSAPPGRVGLAGGALNASRQVGSALGVALLGSLVAGGGFIAGMHAAGALAAATFLAAAGIALRWVGRTAPGM